MLAKRYGEIDKRQWDDFVAKSPEAWLYHTSGYMDWALEEGNDSRSFALCTESGEISAICPLYFIHYVILSPKPLLRLFQRVMNRGCHLLGTRSPWELRVLSTGYSGLAFKGGLRKKNKRRYVREILLAIDEIAAREAIDELQVRNVDVTAANEDNYLLPLLWSGGLVEPLSIPVRLFSRIDLACSETEIWSEIDEDCRAEINRARREGVVCDIDPDNSFDRFYAVHAVSWDRTLGHHKPIDHFRGMVRHLGDAVHFFVGTYKGTDVSAIMVHCYKDGVFYYSGGSLIEGQKVKSNNFVLFNAVQWAKAHGFRWFGVGLFDAFPGLNRKEYYVGQYKAQFTGRHMPAVEAKKYYSRKAVHRDYLVRRAQLSRKNE